jgi:hypothetical protein
MRSTFLTAILTFACLPSFSSAADAPEPATGPFAQPNQVTLTDYFPSADPETGFDETLPRPDEVIGHSIGSKFARHDLVVAWFEALAAASAKVELVEIGRSHEGRRQITAIISSVRNIDRLAEVQRAHLANETDAPLFTWHGYSVHGNEASGVQAAMAVAWYLAASNDDDVRELLRSTVVMIDPSLNPDGYGRFSTWANHAAGRVHVADPAHRERTEFWPGGRGNHYFFDLNRDWLLLQHPESINRVQFLQKYQPLVMTDHHEMGSDRTFFFQPGVESRWHPMIPTANRELTERLGSFHARALDRAERLYYRGESFDDFYPGKGSTWPDLQGTVGVLFEQASTAGLVRDTEQGRITLPMAIHNHVIATLSTLTGSKEMASDLRRYRGDHQERKHVPGGLPGAWIFDDGGDPSRAAAMVDVLKGQGLSVFGITETVRGANGNYLPGRAWVVPVLGAQAPLVQTLFEDVLSFEDTTFYDVSAWSLAHAFGVRASPLSRVPSKLDTGSHVNRNYGISGRRDASAWVLPWDDFYAPTVLARLQAAGVRARVALNPFESTSDGESVSFRRGAIVIHEADVPDMDERKRDFLARLAAGDAPLVGLDTGRSSSGPDLGSPRLRPLQPAKIALLTGRGVNPSSAGSIWHALDARLGYPVSLVAPEVMSEAVLNRHTHLIIADGEYEEVSEELAVAIGRWTEAGGVLILVRRAATWAQTQGWLPDPKLEDPEKTRFAYGEMAAKDGAQQVGGAILSVRLDETHPLAFGIRGGRIGVMKRGTTVLKAPWDNPFTVAGAYADSPLLSGYLPEGFAADIADTPAILAVPKDEGVIVAFADAPAFRAVWWSSQRILANAISFGNVIDTPQGIYGPGDKDP